MNRNCSKTHPASQTNDQHFFRIFMEEHGQVTEGKHDLLALQMRGSLDSPIGYKRLLSSFYFNGTDYGLNPLCVIKDIRILDCVSNLFGCIEGFELIAPEDGKVFHIPYSQGIVIEGQKKKATQC